MPPRISVVLPVYNPGPYLRPAIDSILNQSYADFEFIIIDDGSTDGSGQVIDSYKDSRLRIYHQTNQGVMATLNRGLELARGEYIARMDHDDLSYPQRFQKQVEFLDAHPDHVILGTTYAYIDTTGTPRGVFPALLHDDDIRREIITKSPLGHGSTMIRGSVIREHHLHYRSTYIDDYDLWVRLVNFGKIANLPDVLYAWRHHPGSITHVHFSQQRQEFLKLQDTIWPTLDTLQLISWPGWRRLQRYKNEYMVIEGMPLRVARRNAHSSLYLNLALLFAGHRLLGPTIKSLVYSLLIQPLYPFHALWKKFSFRSTHENLLSQ